MDIDQTAQNSINNLRPLFACLKLEPHNKSKGNLCASKYKFFPIIQLAMQLCLIIKSSSSSSSHYAEQKIFNEMS